MTSKISIRRGDDECITVDQILDESGAIYEMQPDDYMVLTVRELPTDESPVLLESTSNGNAIPMPHKLTTAIPVGVYSCDISLFIARGNGTYTRKTILPDDEYIAEYGKRGSTKNWKNFIVNAEVGNG